ncbi:SPOR domain-containing protein [Paenibacillus antri]|uniref:SPOR domain-containing protein n=1 Tax=Paenibacillus antri TaxID=2582848 RepID=A0A5R9GKJ7_9BACL|nr:SPOR domain-containing protein [Paenibacillus antri]TLS53523.1 SPOR domain-containing protein [Paenibacillus antri]
MSKARMTFRFDNTRRAAAGQAGEAPIDRHRELVAPETDAAAEPEKEAKNGSAREAKEPPSNVIPLRHYEFQVSEEPIVLEERPMPPSPPPARRIDAEYPYDYGAWNDTSSAEADELERLIRETDAYEPEPEPERPRGRSGERGRAAPPRYSPEEARRLYERLSRDEEEVDGEAGYWPGVSEPPPRAARASAMRRRTQDGPAWWKVAASVVGAIATGVLFGSFVLNFFVGDPPSTALPGVGESGAAQQEGAGAPADGAPAEGTDAGETPATSDAGGVVETATADVQLPERRMFLLQNGKFETLEAARTLAADMKSKGLAATIEEGDGFFVYAGVSSDRDSALRAGVKLQAQGVEVYVKPYELPKVAQVRWADGSAEALGDYVTKGSDMVRIIGDLTMVHLEGDAPVAPEKATLEKLQSEHLALSKLSSPAAAGLPADAQPMLKRMDDAVRNAIVAVEEYAAHPDHAYLWSAQSALMDYVIAEKQLLMTIATM